MKRNCAARRAPRASTMRSRSACARRASAIESAVFSVARAIAHEHPRRRGARFAITRLSCAADSSARDSVVGLIAEIERAREAAKELAEQRLVATLEGDLDGTGKRNIVVVATPSATSNRARRRDRARESAPRSAPRRDPNACAPPRARALELRWRRHRSPRPGRATLGDDAGRVRRVRHGDSALHQHHGIGELTNVFGRQRIEQILASSRKRRTPRAREVRSTLASSAICARLARATTRRRARSPRGTRHRRRLAPTLAAFASAGSPSNRPGRRAPEQREGEERVGPSTTSAEGCASIDTNAMLARRYPPATATRGALSESFGTIRARRGCSRA